MSWIKWVMMKDIVRNGNSDFVFICFFFLLTDSITFTIDTVLVGGRMDDIAVGSILFFLLDASFGQRKQPIESGRQPKFSLMLFIDSYSKKISSLHK